MVLPDLLGVGLAAVQRGDAEHSEPDDVLGQEPERGDDAEVAVDRVEVGAIADELVDLDADDANGEDDEGQEVEAGVDLLADRFLLPRVCRLQDEDRLDEDEQAERLREGMHRKED